MRLRIPALIRPSPQFIRHLTFLPHRHLSLPSLFTALFRYGMPPTTRKLPECWGHRGASAAFPENTLASFEAAMQDGADGIESDVHVSLDGVVVMFHDPSLNRTTNGTGLIKERNWYGEDGMEHLRTVKEPKQSIPTFAETVALLMKPENEHVMFNIDVKPGNDPHHLFTLMHTTLSAQPNWETKLAPRIILGLWHPTFLSHAKEILPNCKRSYIGGDTTVARTYFWDNVDVFSMWFASLATADGEAYVICPLLSSSFQLASLLRPLLQFPQRMPSSQ
ncbi:PLC-like phosphodiesterase [Irpex rosettiformis]|uniref:PLC-like phosphodiesterase n=1 Tax=Irpex rosettiformis TaxID=378272 RepID=A0ACB8UCY1_9APHY|nr:PLC-like phosphodiesterase [Irpex rosettiformis]